MTHFKIKPLDWAYDDLTAIYTANPMPGVYYNIQENKYHGWRYGANMYQYITDDQDIRDVVLTDWVTRLLNAIEPVKTVKVTNDNIMEGLQ